MGCTASVDARSSGVQPVTGSLALSVKSDGVTGEVKSDHRLLEEGQAAIEFAHQQLAARAQSNQERDEAQRSDIRDKIEENRVELQEKIEGKRSEVQEAVDAVKEQLRHEATEKKEEVEEKVAQVVHDASEQVKSEVEKQVTQAVTEAVAAQSAVNASAAEARAEVAQVVTEIDQARSAAEESADAARKEIEQTIAAASQVVNKLDNLREGLLGGLAKANDDGTYTADTCVLNIDLASPLLKHAFGKIVFSLSAVAKEFQGAKVVCTILEACYSMYNSSASKSRWSSEFMCYLKMIEGEIVLGREEFKQQQFLNQLEQVLKASQQRLEAILKRPAISSFIFATSDESALQELRLQIESLKKDAIQGMLTEIKADTAAINAKLESMITDLQSQKSASGGLLSMLPPVAQELLDTYEKLEAAKKLQAMFGLLENVGEVTQRAESFQNGARQAICQAFDEWSYYHGSAPYSDADRIFLLLTAPGMGRTSLAAKFVQTRALSLGAANFSSMATGTESGPASHKNDPFMIIKSICYQLTLAIPAYKTWLTEQVRDNKDGFVERVGANFIGGQVKADQKRFASIKAMFDELIVQPLHAINLSFYNALTAETTTDFFIESVKSLQSMPKCIIGLEEVAFDANTRTATLKKNPSHKLLILFDSLDQVYAPSSHSAASDDDDLVTVISTFAPKLPTWIGIVVTARTDQRIVKGFAKYNTKTILPYSESNQADLRAYINSSLPTASPELTKDLLNLSQGSWLYLSRLVALKPSGDTVDETISTRVINEIGTEYWMPILQSLKRSIESETSESTSSWAQSQEVLKLILSGPKSLSELEAGVTFDAKQLVAAIVARLGSLLLTRDDGKIELVHQSIGKWMTSEDRQQSHEEADFHIPI